MIFYRTFQLYQLSRSLINHKYFSTSKMTDFSQNIKTNPIVAISHMRSTSNKVENLEQVTTIVQEAKEKLAEFVFLPECCDFVGENRQQTIELAETLNGPTVKAYKNLAKNNQIWLSLGGIHEMILNSNGNKTDKINNSHIIIDDCGDIVEVYRKLHLFDVQTPEFRFHESDVVEKGKELKIPLPTPIGNLGLLICYDVRFAEMSTILRKLGAEILTYPAAFAFSTGKAGHWETLLKARAIENQCYVIAPAQIGFHHPKRQSWGHGMIIDPWGKVLAVCDNNSELDVAVAEINHDNLQKVRKNMPCFEHRRTDIYSLMPVDLKTTECDVDMKFSNYTINKNTIFYHTQYCFAFTNIRCVVPGHVLIAPKRVVHRLKDLTSEEITDLFQCVVRIQRLIEPYYNCTSSTVTVQDGPEAGQTVRHVHFHVMPRKLGDFEHNDLIYIELNRHDHSENGSPERSEVDRIAEAKIYRKLLEQKI